MKKEQKRDTEQPNAEILQFQKTWKKARDLWRSQPGIALDPLIVSNSEILSQEAAVEAGIVRLLNSDEQTVEHLFGTARITRDRHVGRKIDLRAAIDISNVCRVNCSYCPMRRDNLKRRDEFRTTPARASAKHIIEAAEQAYELGFRNLFLQSGEDPQILPVAEEAITTITSRQPDWNIILNLGSLNADQYRRLRQAGAKDYLIKHETANPRLHQEQRGESLETRVRHMILAREAGFKVGSGNILGLPGQTDEDLARDLIFLGRFNPTTVSTSPFTPSVALPDKFRYHPAGGFEKTKRFVSLLRICFPEARIPAVSNTDSPLIKRNNTGLSGQSEVIMAGANGITVNFTPNEIERHYGLYESGVKPYLVDMAKARRVSEETGLSLDLVIQK